jgi:hypothetical protein
VQPCIVDSCSLLHAFHVQVGDSCLSDLIAKHFDVIVHSTVERETRRVLGRAYAQWRERGLVSKEIGEIKRNHANWIAAKCSSMSPDTELHTLEADDLAGLDAGEVGCIALAKLVADQRVCYALFVTDDFDAGECAKQVFDKYQCGMIVSSADLVSFFGIRYKLPKLEIHQALRNLIAFYTNLYESLLKELESLLPGSVRSVLYPLVRAADFARATQAVSRLSLGAQTRSQLVALIHDVGALAGERSTLAQALSRLRTLDRLSL